MFTISYFFAMIFKIALDFQEDVIRHQGNSEVERFLTYNSLGHDDIDELDSMIIFIYFSFTSLTTVGFGDYNPRSDFERLYIAFGLLYGVAIFSYIMGEFIEMISNIEKYAENDGD
jgi:hypothetical protein